MGRSVNLGVGDGCTSDVRNASWEIPGVEAYFPVRLISFMNAIGLHLAPEIVSSDILNRLPGE